MFRGLVAAVLLATGTQAFAPVPIRWAAASGKSFVIGPEGFLYGDLSLIKAFPVKLTIGDRLGWMSPNDIPRFTATSESTIVWDSMDLCVEASGDRKGEAIRVNRCTGAPTQLWTLSPRGLGKNQIQLKGTNLCIDVPFQPERDSNGAAVELQECADRESESWIFEEPALATATSSGQVAIASVLLIVLGALSLGAGIWHKQSKGRSAAMTNMDNAGVSLEVPLAAHENHLQSTSSLNVSVNRMIPAVMALSPATTKYDEKEEGSREAEITNGRACMLACSGFLAQGKPSIGVGICETLRIQKSLAEPSVSACDHGDDGFDPLGLITPGQLMMPSMVSGARSSSVLMQDVPPPPPPKGMTVDEDGKNNMWQVPIAQKVKEADEGLNIPILAAAAVALVAIPLLPSLFAVNPDQIG